MRQPGQETDVEQKQKILGVLGPTASGKTALAIALAQRLYGEVISNDSMQIYKGMLIGTAAPTKAEMGNRSPSHDRRCVPRYGFFLCRLRCHGGPHCR